MPSSKTKSVPQSARALIAWNEIAHDLANELAALKLALTAASTATEEQERAGHFELARQTLKGAEAQLEALRKAVRLQAGGSRKNPPPASAKARERK